MRLASLEMPASGFPAENVDPLALARHAGFFGDRLVLDEHLDSFDERFGGAVVSSDTAPAKISEREEPADTTGQPSLDLREQAPGQPAMGRGCAEAGRCISAR
jgi:hypothetical protein